MCSGVMPSNILSLLKCATNCEHFFVPLIYNDSDDRWDENSFWSIPKCLPSTLRSFRGFDAQTPLKFVHQCIVNLPNIEEFHVVLYFGSAHPDFIACGYTNDTLIHLAQNCKLLQSFEGYFHSTQQLLDGVELMIQNCTVLKLIGLLFHPDVNDNDIDDLVNNIRDSTICSKFNPKFSRLQENPNTSVTLKVLEITFDHSRTLHNNHQIKKININDSDDNKMNVDIVISDNNDHNDNDDNTDQVFYDGNVSNDHLKSLDEIEISDEDDDIINDDDDQELIGLDERHRISSNRNNNNRNNNNHNHNHNNSDNDSQLMSDGSNASKN